MWWHIPVTPATWEGKTGESQVQAWAILSLGNFEKAYPKINNNKKKIHGLFYFGDFPFNIFKA